VVKDSIDVLGLLRKRGMEGDVDFLREALAVLVQAIMEAEVTEQVGAGYTATTTKGPADRHRRGERLTHAREELQRY